MSGEMTSASAFAASPGRRRTPSPRVSASGIARIPRRERRFRRWRITSITSARSRGYSDEDVQKILGRNLLGVMRSVEETSARLRTERGPSEALIEELDSKKD